MTYWVYEIFCLDGEKPRSLVIAPCDDLAKALAGAFKDATYYINECSYTVGVTFKELCAGCGGTGVVRSKRSAWKSVVCKACKGRDTFQKVQLTVLKPYRDCA